MYIYTHVPVPTCAYNVHGANNQAHAKEPQAQTMALTKTTRAEAIDEWEWVSSVERIDSIFTYIHTYICVEVCV